MIALSEPRLCPCPRVPRTANGAQSRSRHEWFWRFLSPRSRSPPARERQTMRTDLNARAFIVKFASIVKKQQYKFINQLSNLCKSVHSHNEVFVNNLGTMHVSGLQCCNSTSIFHQVNNSYELSGKQSPGIALSVHSSIGSFRFGLYYFYTTVRRLFP